MLNPSYTFTAAQLSDLIILGSRLESFSRRDDPVRLAIAKTGYDASKTAGIRKCLVALHRILSEDLAFCREILALANEAGFPVEHSRICRVRDEVADLERRIPVVETLRDSIPAGRDLFAEAFGEPAGEERQNSEAEEVARRAICGYLEGQMFP